MTTFVFMTTTVFMNNAATADQLTAAIAYWTACQGKGTAGQRRMVARELRTLRERLAALG